MNDYLGYWRKKNNRLDIKKTQIDHIELFIEPNIFDPDLKITYSTGIILDHFPDVSNKKVLDIGTGSGILIIKSIKNNAKLGVGIDIDTKSLRNARFNSEINDTIFNSTFISSNLFSNVYDRFDIIFANLPFIEEDSENTLSELICNYRNYLLPGGKVYLTYASFGMIDNPKKYISGRVDLKEYYEMKRFGEDWYLFVIQ